MLNELDWFDWITLTVIGAIGVYDAHYGWCAFFGYCGGRLLGSILIKWLPKD